MTEAAGLWWSDSDSDSDNLRNIAPNSTISNMDEVEEISDSDSNNDNYRNIHINNYREGVMGLLSVRDHLDVIESIFNEVEDRYVVRDSDEDW
ncbi:unnamed protein product [Macrosiphum euphorbiae]|uniref:Uncharacterized protein n=1 Tax=Macrosiphum euphorbiae TaxID=13131 RepID=A0AAV0Y9B2_9HEMI|nr:unnamed protein product [Macrosiphum euphorbiae]CAI6375874.1 unnamed protein product [Macrosiphum euphorbiae]CAI6377056.1 unnamed protein product [Macrosiphum euphorbiae]